MNTSLKIFIGVIVGVVLGFLAGTYTEISDTDDDEDINHRPKSASNFEECIALGNPVMESFPRQCRDEAGNHFTEDIGNELEKTDLIRIHTPRPNDVIESPLTIRGEARGKWFFEASFPVMLKDGDGRLIVNHFAMTASEWMTEDFVPFETVIEFERPSDLTKKGVLILAKDNPSGLPEHNDALEIPVRFK